jgi:hypothetical protein
MIVSDEGNKLTVELPGEWALKKTLGPILSEIGDDLKKLYASGRDKIINKAYKKIENPEDGKSANLRVAHDVLTNGAFTDDEICAEYFGGILASSRTEDGKNDDAIQLLSTIKSLSSKQLHLHYVIFNSLNKLLISKKQNINVAQSTEIGSKKLWFATKELESIGIKHDTDLNILHRQGLIEAYETNFHKLGEHQVLPFAKITPTTYGILLYAVAHNKLGSWRRYPVELFPDFENVKLPRLYAFTIEELLTVAGLNSVVKS